MWSTIVKPFAWLLLQFYEWTGNYGISIILFAFVINLILLPFMAKSKKGMMKTSRLQPKIQELQRRHEGNPQKLNEEMAKLYREEHVNPASGCLWSLIPFPIMIALYSVIREPLTRMLYLTTAEVTKVTNFLVTNGWYTIPKKAGAYDEITVLQQLHAHWSNVVSSGLQSQVPGLKDISFNFLGLNLGSMPDWKFAVNVNWSDTTSWLPALGLFLIPIISAVLSWASMKVSNLSNPPDPKTQAQMKSMNLLMPLMSIWFCFIMPAALGVYWIANSVFGMARDYWLTIHYRKRLDAEDAERESQRSEREKQMEAKRQETERLKEEGRTEVNSNTSKRKMQAKEKQTYEERRAAAEKAERAERRARRGLSANDAPPSQVGNRRFARGRAYDPERFGDQQDPVSAGEGNTIPEQPEYDAEEPADSVEGVGIDAAADEAEDTAYDEDADTAEDADAAEEPDEDEDSDK